ncbi:uncharacterized protein [Malus domestica]|uniref:uncharacterized protein isoform X1 n=1 Tax=Malus domestica TaxID=3750 RepID=UPI003974C14E
MGSLWPQKPVKVQLGPVVLDMQMVEDFQSPDARAVAGGGGGGGGEGEGKEEYVYRIITAVEWGELQSSGSIFGGELDKKSGFIHLSNLNQLGEGLVYEVVDGSNSFPHFYGPSRSFIPLPLDAVTKADICQVANSVAVYWNEPLKL